MHFSILGCYDPEPQHTAHPVCRGVSTDPLRLIQSHYAKRTPMLVDEDDLGEMLRRARRAARDP